MILLCVFIAVVFGGCSRFGGAPDGTCGNTVEEHPEDTALAGLRQTTLYYQSDDGMIVPVMKLLPWEEGIGRAALNQLVDTDENRLAATAMGLKTLFRKASHSCFPYRMTP
jgi:germination protein M